MLTNISGYQPPDHLLWQGRNDSLPGERFFQHIKLVDLTKQGLENNHKATVIIGFCSDEGIRRNEGRVGARTGPLVLRQQLAKLAYHGNKTIIDVGNIVCENQALELAQEQFATIINYCHQQGYKTIALGGGHEIAWGHYKGLRSHYPGMGIINFDAHFDLRSLQQEIGANSGTPFWQIAQFCQQQQQAFSYCCLGIQELANTQSLFTFADQYKVSYLTAEQIHHNPMDWQFAFIDDFMVNHQNIYLSVCLDVLAESFAPGVSAPQALGLTPWQIFPLLKYIIQTGKVKSIDIAELSPALDQGQKTARLAATIMAKLLEF